METADSHDAASRSAALRVLGVVETLAGELEVGLEHSRAAVDDELAPHRWVLANAMLAMILFDVGQTEEGLSVAQDGAALSQRAGFETSFGTFHAGVAARCLVRLGRWEEADNVLAGVASLESTPIGAIQLDAAGAPLAARRGRLEAAADLAERLRRHPSDPFSDAIIDAALVDVHLAAKQWDSGRRHRVERAEPEAEQRLRGSWRASPPVWSSAPSNEPWTSSPARRPSTSTPSSSISVAGSTWPALIPAPAARPRWRTSPSLRR